MTDSVSRGYWSIKEVVDRMAPLMEWTKQFKPEQTFLRLAKKDYDLIKRWPGAAKSFDIHVHAVNGIWWNGLELTHDTSVGRYVKPPAPTQTDLEKACRI